MLGSLGPAVHKLSKSAISVVVVLFLLSNQDRRLREVESCRRQKTGRETTIVLAGLNFAVSLSRQLFKKGVSYNNSFHAQILSQRQNNLRVVPEIDNKRLRVAGIKSFLLISVMLALQMIIFFISAGHIVGPRPWIIFGASFIHYTISTAVQYKLNPELLVQRLKRKREGSKLWDEILMRVSNLTVLIAIPAMAGLDIGRFQWSDLDVQFAVMGFAFFIASTILINWAMAVNPHFEPTVRIQKDRGHKVISSGPYKIIRHPGYLAGILYTLSIPPIIGSVFTFIPVGIYAILFLIRTSLEDRTLQEELDGYSEYAKQVKHKLFPGIW